MELKKQIIDYRINHNLTQLQFAKLCGVSNTTINNIENDKAKPHALSSKKILDVINKEGNND